MKNVAATGAIKKLSELGFGVVGGVRMHEQLLTAGFAFGQYRETLNNYLPFGLSLSKPLI